MRSWPFVLLLVGVSMTSLLMACRSNPITQAEDAADRTIQRVEQAGDRTADRVDRSVSAALYRLDQSVLNAQKQVSETVGLIKAEYEDALAGTSDEVTKLREEFKADIDDLEGKLEERIEQIRSSALEVVSETDKATQARIDQVFTELRLFMTETLVEIRELIGPVLELATVLQSSVENGNEHIAKISTKIIELIEQVQAVFAEVKDVLHQVQGENEKGEKTSVPMTEIVVGLITAIVALITAITTKLQRSSERKRQGERWKEEELEHLITARVAKKLKDGTLDDEVLGILSRLDLVKTKANGGMNHG